MSAITYRSQKKVHTLVAVGLFTALAYVCCLVFHFKAGFLTFDLKDAVMMIGAMIFGPLYGLAMVLIVALIEMFTVSDTYFYGFVMNVLSSGAFVIVGSSLYVKKRTMKGALTGTVLAVLAMIIVMMIANLVITPFYMHVGVDAVVKMLPTLLLPFNLLKAVFNASLVFIFYKPVTDLLRHAGFSSASPEGNNEIHDTHSGNKRFAVTVISCIIAIICLLFFFFVLQGSFHFGK